MKKSILTLALLSSSLLAGEADHYTRRFEPISDMAPVINKQANEFLEKSIKMTNQKSSCDENELYSQMRKYFANHTKGKLVKFALHDNLVERRMIGLGDSIYGKWKIYNGYLMGKPSAAESPLALTPMIRIGDEVVGTDKLEHMFGMGFKYFTKHHLEGKNLRKVLKFGVFLEKTTLGGNILATGVFAYSDLSANFNGMRFWNHVLQKRDDVINDNIGPYVKCVDKKFVSVKDNPIDFSKYIDKSMDESINCSKFATKSGMRKVKRSLKRLSEKYGVELTCPMNPAVLEEMVQKYNVEIKNDRKQRTIGHYILNNDGFDDVSYFNEF
ncbi:MAG: hypothetical protein KC493_18030 [Bacteriovoracaceae bacterium]|nr:hypothetical protein [Bacteriovoracaceae bacterium]